MLLSSKGENDWIVQMMLASSSVGEGGHDGVASLEEVEEDTPSAMADVTEMIVKKATLVQQAKEKTNLMQKAHERRRRLSQRR